jgi:hypothetical protein
MTLATIRLFAHTSVILTARKSPKHRLRLEKPERLIASAPLFPFNPG